MDEFDEIEYNLQSAFNLLTVLRDEKVYEGDDICLLSSMIADVSDVMEKLDRFSEQTTK